MKHLEETPWFICNKEDKNYCAYVDTDSNYFNAEPILKHLYPNFEELSDIEKDSKLEKVALAYQDIITEDYDRLARETFNITTHRLEMKTECVTRSAYFRTTIPNTPNTCLLYTSPSPRDRQKSRMPSSA